MDFFPFLHIAPLFFIALVVPGPDFMMVSSLSLSRGRNAGLWAALGIATGIIYYASICLWGLALLFEQVFWLMVTIKIAGGLYLVYLGVMLWRASMQKDEEDTGQEKIAPETKKSAYRMGLLTSLTNPKAVAFFASIFALAVTPDTTTATKIGTSLLCAAMTFGWFGFVACALSTPRLRKSYQKTRKAIDRVAGTIMTAFGLKLLFSSGS